MGDIAKQKLATAEWFCIFGGSFFAHPLPEIPTKHNIKETASMGNIWGPFYMYKGDGSGGGLRIIKYYVMKNIYINPNLNNLFRNV